MSEMQLHGRVSAHVGVLIYCYSEIADGITQSHLINGNQIFKKLNHKFNKQKLIYISV